MEGLSQSSFYKWRCLIALASVDAKLDPEEIKFFSSELGKLHDEGITEEQMKVLSDDLRNPKQPEVFFVRIDDVYDKIDLVRMAYFLFNSDSVFETRERQVYDYLLEQVSEKIDLTKEELDRLAKIEHKGLGVSIKPVVKELIERARAHKIKKDE